VSASTDVAPISWTKGAVEASSRAPDARVAVRARRVPESRRASSARSVWTIAAFGEGGRARGDHEARGSGQPETS
jgi:hypothetical protein